MICIIQQYRQQQENMQFSNPYEQQAVETNPQKLSIVYIQQAYYHRIQIKSISSMYKLTSKIKKPIILSLHGLAVVSHISSNVQYINTILQIDNLHELRVIVPGYGIFNQKYELETVANLFGALGDFGVNVCRQLKRLVIQFPGWRTVSQLVITKVFHLIKTCKYLQQVSINLNYTMNLTPSVPQDESITFYGPQLLTGPQFETLMRCLTSQLPSQTLTKLELRFGAWECVNSKVIEILAIGVEGICQRYKNLRVLKLDLHGWGKGNYASEQDKIGYSIVEGLFKMIEDIDGENCELLQIDMRQWPSELGISKFKERFIYLNGGWRKRDDGKSVSNLWSMTGTNFFGSQIASRISKKIKVQIID